MRLVCQELAGVYICSPANDELGLPLESSSQSPRTKCQLSISVRFETPLATLRRYSRHKEQGRKGIVNKMKKAQGAYNFINHTKSVPLIRLELTLSVADVELSVILKAFSATMWKGGVTKAKFGVSVTSYLAADIVRK